jgi:hypothetical protein
VDNRISESYRRPSIPAVDMSQDKLGIHRGKGRYITGQIQSKTETEMFQKMSSRKQVLQKVRIPDYSNESTN